MPSNADRPARPLWPLLLAAFALALVPRLAIVFAPRADLFGPAQGDFANIALGEELTRGDVAMELVQGPLLSLSDYQYAHFFGGATVCGIVAAPLFAVFGAQLWALKLAAIAFHLVALGFGIALLDRWVSRRAALFFGLLFAVAPPGYSLLTTVAWGSHVESGMFALVCFYLFLDLEGSGPEFKQRALRRFSFGACAGFALWFNYSCLIFLAVLALFDAIADRRIWRPREFALQLAGALLGALPWFVYNLRNDWAGVSIYGASLVEHVGADGSGGSKFGRVLDLALRALPGGFFFHDLAGLPRAFWDALGCGLLFVLALVPWFLRSKSRPRPFLMAWTYLALFWLAYSLSDFEVGRPPDDIRSWRYVMLPVPMLLLAAACGLEVIAARSAGAARGAWITACLWALLGLAGASGFVDASRAFKDLGREGASQLHFGRWMALRYATQTEMLEKLCARMMLQRSEADQQEFFRGMASVLRNSSRPQPGMGPGELERVDDYQAAMRWLSEHAPEPYRALFQPRD